MRTYWSKGIFRFTLLMTLWPWNSVNATGIGINVSNSLEVMTLQKFKRPHMYAQYQKDSQHQNLRPVRKCVNYLPQRHAKVAKYYLRGILQACNNYAKIELNRRRTCCKIWTPHVAWNNYVKTELNRRRTCCKIWTPHVAWNNYAKTELNRRRTCCKIWTPHVAAMLIWSLQMKNKKCWLMM